MKKQFAKNKLSLTISSAIVLSTLTLTACELDNGESVQSVKELGSYSLVKAQSDDKFLEYYSSALNRVPNPYILEPEVDEAVEDNVEGGDLISSTNLIESGVDELDFVKQNATHIFTSKGSGNYEGSDTLKVYSKPSAEGVGKLELGQSVGIKGFFLKDNNLYNISQQSYGGNRWRESSNSRSYENGVIALKEINASNPASPEIEKSYNWEGNYINSRRIGDKIYVVSSSQLNDPWICADVMPEPELIVLDSGEVIETAVDIEMPYNCSERKELTKEEIAERMPVDINGAKVKPSDCFIPNKYNQGSDNINLDITLITEVDLTGSNHKTTCVSASAESFYMSPNALYLASKDYTSRNPFYNQKTIINKFKIDSDSVKYGGSGVVEGDINWDTASFSLSEYDDVLRVVTSMWKDTGIYNMLHTLKESDTEYTLENLAKLPNENQPANIGKPNESIKGVRFLGDEGYVVTFETKDPLYKIDLSDPINPKIVGELEMPGYSAYLHRVSDKYLLGVGYSTDESTRPDGVQVTVFDTSGDNPVIVDQDVISTGEAWLQLAVAADSRAITTLLDTNVMRLSIPYSLYYYKGNSNKENKAVEYDIDLSTGLLSNKVERDHQIALPLYGQNILRSLISNDDIYYTFNDELIKYKWSVQQIKVD